VNFRPFSAFRGLIEKRFSLNVHGPFIHFLSAPTAFLLMEEVRVRADFVRALAAADRKRKVIR